MAAFSRRPKSFRSRASSAADHLPRFAGLLSVRTRRPFSRPTTSVAESRQCSERGTGHQGVLPTDPTRKEGELDLIRPAARATPSVSENERRGDLRSNQGLDDHMSRLQWRSRARRPADDRRGMRVWQLWRPARGREHGTSDPGVARQGRGRRGRLHPVESVVTLARWQTWAILQSSPRARTLLDADGHRQPPKSAPPGPRATSLYTRDATA